MSSSSSSIERKFLVAQLGARMHYAVPQILHEANQLERLYTDLSATAGWPRYLQRLPDKLRPESVKRLLGRMPQGIPPDRISSFPSFGWEYARRRRAAKSASEMTETNLWAGRTFCDLIVKHGFGDATGVYAFNSAALELLKAAKAAGLTAALEQTIAPRRVEMALIGAEEEAFPDWGRNVRNDLHTAAFGDREADEWQEADVIFCGSEFVRQSIAECGGPAERCRVIPYGVRPAVSPAIPSAHDGPLRVLTVGEVGLRKGSPYVLAVAQQLSRLAKFRMAGTINVPAPIESRLRERIELLGPVPRSEIHRHFAWADVFLLPSLCEGSATSVYEALAAGLPVICTPNTGSIVRDSRDGFIVPIRDVEATIDRLMQLSRDCELRA